MLRVLYGFRKTGEHDIYLVNDYNWSHNVPKKIFTNGFTAKAINVKAFIMAKKNHYNFFVIINPRTARMRRQFRMMDKVPMIKTYWLNLRKRNYCIHLMDRYEIKGLPIHLFIVHLLVVQCSEPENRLCNGVDD